MRVLRMAVVAALMVTFVLFPSGAFAGTVPLLSSNPTSTSAGPIVLTAGSSRTISVSNADNSKSSSALVVTLTKNPSSADFAVTADGCSGVSLGPKKSCSVTVSYTGATPSAVETAQVIVSSKKPRATSTSYFSAAPGIVAMSRTADGGGYWLVGSDGSVFGFGNASFHGSLAGATLAHPIVAMSPTADGGGYWLVGSDGSVFGFGNASNYGSL
ncbi:MAG: hypothetical protein ABIM89_13535 [Mycobacteriales bacterium]